MKSRLFHIILVVAMLIPATGFANEHYNALFEQANAAYKQGNYDTAKTLYAEIAQNGMVSKALFYNLGNTHFKLGNTPASILFYERALRLDPNDEDVLYNLEIANSYITDKIEAVDKVFFISWWNNVALAFSSTFWSWLFIAMLTLAAALFAVFFTSRKIRSRQLGLLGGLGMVIAAMVVYLLAQTATSIIQREEAIVFAPSVNVKNEPSINGSDQFVIHEGLKVSVEDTEGDWTRITLADGNTGWLPTRSIERI